MKREETPARAYLRGYRERATHVRHLAQNVLAQRFQGTIEALEQACNVPRSQWWLPEHVTRRNALKARLLELASGRLQDEVEAWSRAGLQYGLARMLQEETAAARIARDKAKERTEAARDAWGHGKGYTVRAAPRVSDVATHEQRVMREQRAALNRKGHRYADGRVRPGGIIWAEQLRYAITRPGWMGLTRRTFCGRDPVVHDEPPRVDSFAVNTSDVAGREQGEYAHAAGVLGMADLAPGSFRRPDAMDKDGYLRPAPARKGKRKRDRRRKPRNVQRKGR